MTLLPRVRRLAALARATAAMAESVVAELERPLDGRQPDPIIVHAALTTVHANARRIATHASLLLSACGGTRELTPGERGVEEHAQKIRAASWQNARPGRD